MRTKTSGADFEMGFRLRASNLETIVRHRIAFAPTKMTRRFRDGASSLADATPKPHGQGEVMLDVCQTACLGGACFTSRGHN